MHDTLVTWAGIIAASVLSTWFRDHLWVIPTSQSIHIICVSVLFAASLVISLRVLGLSRSGRGVLDLTTTLVPWIYRSLVGLLLTGVVQTIAEPLRQFVTPAFWWKMSLIVCNTALTMWFARTARSDAARWDESGSVPVSGKVFAVLSIGLWVAIIYCGRFIGYTYEEHL